MAARERAPDGDGALRHAIAQLAADVIRLSAASADGQPLPSGAGRTIARETDAPSTQGPPNGEDATPAKPRKLQSIAPGR
jgi:hypothetical protein